MSQPRIVRVPIVPFGVVNCHLVISEQGCVLVDTGVPGSHRKIERALKAEGLGLQDIRLIVVTHAHMDHAGSAARVRQLSGAPIVAHEGDLPYYQRRKPMTFCETGWVSRLFFRTGVIVKPYEAFTPDILLTDGQALDLAPYGIAGRARPTPGHTAGSVSLELDSGDALVGDLVASGVLLGGLMHTQHARRPPFEDDPATVALQLQQLVAGGMQTFHLGHGGPLPAKEVMRHAGWLGRQRAGRMYQGAVACGCESVGAGGAGGAHG
ncbi:MBL fold metallo-hydrolase [Piscinibacter gummiphilus]|uniref:MBL fold metallo-hydrolase n=1 Tax=Piscinibacter gummiphilus TaxID=946333 RepID=A0ABZ0CQ62_9BURK|nr:MBL fold metallo-hydrolase [Piscinibacter gummiphilus]WOB06666.1 MBL fold metallo-hydrolase [Piscinibacter gummiphilus]